MSSDGQNWNQIDYILCSQRWRGSIQPAKTRPGAYCGSDHEFLIAKFRLKMNSMEKTTRPFRYDLNQIPYDYTVEVTNRFKGLDLIDWVPDELWTEVHDIVQETEIKTIPKKKKCKRARWLSKEALQIAVKRREVKSKDIPIWMHSSKEYQEEISGHVWMWELDCEESWVLKNWFFWTVVLEKTLESPLDFKEIQPVYPKGD